METQSQIGLAIWAGSIVMLFIGFENRDAAVFLLSFPVFLFGFYHTFRPFVRRKQRRDYFKALELKDNMRQFYEENSRSK